MLRSVVRFDRDQFRRLYEPRGPGALMLGRSLRRARRAAGLTQSELAASIGVDQSSIARYESGTQVPRFAVMVQVAASLGRPLADVWATPSIQQLFDACGEDGVAA